MGLNLLLSILSMMMLALAARLLFGRLARRGLLTEQTTRAARRGAGVILLVVALCMIGSAIDSGRAAVVVSAVIYVVLGLVVLFAKPVRSAPPR